MCVIMYKPFDFWCGWGGQLAQRWFCCKQRSFLIRYKNSGRNRIIIITMQDCEICFFLIQNCAEVDNCHHRFCFTCISRWPMNTCPICKKVFRRITQYVPALTQKNQKNEEEEIEVHFINEPQTKAPFELLEECSQFGKYSTNELYEQLNRINVELSDARSNLALMKKIHRKMVAMQKSQGVKIQRKRQKNVKKRDQ